MTIEINRILEFAYYNLLIIPYFDYTLEESYIANCFVEVYIIINILDHFKN